MEILSSLRTVLPSFSSPPRCLFSLDCVIPLLPASCPEPPPIVLPFEYPHSSTHPALPLRAQETPSSPPPTPEEFPKPISSFISQHSLDRVLPISQI